ncbi:S8 family serine peptidase [Brevibacillus dissolubilis]|uniref:S8 family serine peptidase n=1 Tax=Brevibacillus dissolubilis TaxID=1844116 RepID=UPI00159B9631|nr:S8 family serine peptidase [Brevibacillus dissolubilis]
MNKFNKVLLLTTLTLSVGFNQAGAEEIVSKQGMPAAYEVNSPQALSLASVPQEYAGMAVSSRLVIIRFDGPIQEFWKQEMAQLGVELGDYLPDYAFIAKLPSAAVRQQLAKHAHVQEVLPFHPAYKLAPGLSTQLNKNGQMSLALVSFSEKGEGLHDSIQKLQKDGLQLDVAPATGDSPRVALVAQATASHLNTLMQSDEIIAIYPILPHRPFNDVAASIIHADQLQQTGYTGKNQIIGVSDSGLDTGRQSDMHPDLADRIVKMIAVGRTNNVSDPDGHGTHVAGSLVGTGKSSHGQVKGMAPDAKLVFHSLLARGGGFLVPDVYDLWDEAYANGARIQSASWGVSLYDQPELAGQYTYDSYRADQFLWDHKDVISLVAAGNDGTSGEVTSDGYRTISSPATAKNVISVGASESLRTDFTTYDADNPDELAEFSSKGPTDDGRIKPDIVAPGTMILSTKSALASDDNFNYVENDYYAYMSGTSMATPVLAGGTAQIRQFLQDKKVQNPSGALIKSMLLTSADDLNLSLAAQGFGRANLQAAITTSFLDESRGMRTGDKQTYTVKVTDKNKPFVVSLVWTDYPSTTPIATKRLVNDLDLEVTSPSGQVLKGNDFEKPYNDQSDRYNNVEQVYIPAETGTYTVRVTANNIPMGPQPYALATNGVFGTDGGSTPGEDHSLFDETSVKTSVKISGTKYKLSVRGKVTNPAVKQIIVDFGGTELKTSVKNGQFSLSKNLDIAGLYVEELTVKAQTSSGKNQEYLTSTETELIKDETLKATESGSDGDYEYEISGTLTNTNGKTSYAVVDDQKIPLRIQSKTVKGTVTSEEQLSEITIVILDRTGGYEVVIVDTTES